MTVNAINTYIVPTAANEVTMPSQPAFLAHLAAGDDDLNVTGNGTAFTVGSGNALTEIFDQNADFNTNGTFTAPVTGRYFFVSSIALNQANLATTGLIQITTSNRNYRFENDMSTDAANNGDLSINSLADMDATDTATIVVTLTGIGADTADVFGATPARYTFFAGNLEV